MLMHEVFTQGIRVSAAEFEVVEKVAKEEHTDVATALGALLTRQAGCILEANGHIHTVPESEATPFARIDVSLPTKDWEKIAQAASASNLYILQFDTPHDIYEQFAAIALCQPNVYDETAPYDTPQTKNSEEAEWEEIVTNIKNGSLS